MQVEISSVQAAHMRSKEAEITTTVVSPYSIQKNDLRSTFRDRVKCGLIGDSIPA